MSVIWKEEFGYGVVLLAGVVFLLARDVAMVLTAIIAVVAIVALFSSGLAGRWWVALLQLVRLRFAAAPDAAGLHDVYFGLNEATQTPIYQNLTHTGNIFVSGQTRFGKTRMLYVLIDDLLVRHSSDELLIGFSDAKEVTFSIYGRLPHLFCPIATNINETEMMLDLALVEMANRKALFAAYADKYICTNLSEYAALSGERLPYIVLVFDELADSIILKSAAEDKLVSLAKMGLAFGIIMILATQRSTAKAISHEAQSQCATQVVTYMKGNTEYGSISGVPKSIYQHMTPQKGRFMVYSPELAEPFTDTYPDYDGWGFVQSPLLSNELLERHAQKLSKGQAGIQWDGYARPEQLPTLPKLTGSMADKMTALAMIADEVKRPLVASDLLSRFDMSKNTATNLLKNWESEA